MATTGTPAEPKERTASVAASIYSYLHGASDEPLGGETIGAALRRQAHQHAGEEALVAVEEGMRLTYEELDTAVSKRIPTSTSSRPAQRRITPARAACSAGSCQ